MDRIITAVRVREVEVRYKNNQKLPLPKRFSNSREIYHFFADKMISERVEIFSVLLLDSKNQLMAIDLIARGSLSMSVVHPREVFSNAVRLQAAAMICMHNHPSGDPAPSREDRDCTHRLYQAGSLLGIRVLDHIIFGDTDYYSFADSGQMTGESL